MKKNINDLTSTLSKCAFNKNKLKSMSQKKQIPKDTIHAPRHTHHARMYAKVYKYTCCGRKGHMAML